MRPTARGPNTASPAAVSAAPIQRPGRLQGSGAATKVATGGSRDPSRPTVDPRKPEGFDLRDPFGLLPLRQLRPEFQKA